MPSFWTIQLSTTQYLLSSGYGIYPSETYKSQDKSAYPGTRKALTVATMKAIYISMCEGRAGFSVKLSIGLFLSFFSYSDFSDMTFTTVTLLIKMSDVNQ